MILILLGIVVGALIGVARGGNLAPFTTLKIKGKPFLLLAIGASLISTLLEPSNPTLFALIGTVSAMAFVASNIAATGAIVLSIGLLLNLAPLVANGTVPISERALTSVGIVDAAGIAEIPNYAESTATASRLAFLGDVIPLPIFDQVVSLGDLIVFVAVADMIMHLMILGKKRAEPKSAPKFAKEPSPKVQGNRRHRAQRLSIHAKSKMRTEAEEPHIVGDVPPRKRRTKIDLTSVEREDFQNKPKVNAASPVRTITDQPSDDLEVIDLTDTRPIIDLTTSPTDEQLAEFLKQRTDADLALSEGSATGSDSTDH